MIIVRDATEADQPFILNSWLLSFDAAAPGLIICAGYMHAALKRGVCKVMVAESDASVIIGWALVCGRTLEYVYVKKAARRLGFARDLVNACGPVMRAAFTTKDWTREYAERIGR